jgi:hypothetical protein
MPRIIVITEHSQPPEHAAVLLDEQVQTVHLSNGHAAAQLVERIAWAISDAEEAEQLPASGPSSSRRSPRRGAQPRRAGRRPQAVPTA